MTFLGEVVSVSLLVWPRLFPCLTSMGKNINTRPSFSRNESISPPDRCIPIPDSQASQLGSRDSTSFPVAWSMAESDDPGTVCGVGLSDRCNETGHQPGKQTTRSGGEDSVQAGRDSKQI